MIMAGKLILVRHGQSTWNLENLFTGWTDVDLSAQGRAEAIQAGQELLKEHLAADLAFTSVLSAPSARCGSCSMRWTACGSRWSAPGG